MLQQVLNSNCRIHLRADYIDEKTIVAIVINGGSILSHDTSVGQHVVTDGYMIFFPPYTVLVANSNFIDKNGYVEEISIFGSYSALIRVNGSHVSIVQKVEEKEDA